MVNYSSSIEFVVTTLFDSFFCFFHAFLGEYSALTGISLFLNVIEVGILLLLYEIS